MRTKKILAAITTATAAVVLTACSSSPDEEFNEADVTFAQDMIPHHRQATEMAALAESRTTNRQVLDLASQIDAAQEPEIETMTDWLESWDQEVPDSMAGHEGMDHSGSMPGMMSEQDMSALEDAQGSAFDEAFLTMMIEHHEGAIEMAATEQEDGSNSDAVALARTIEEDQTAEVDRMRTLLDS